MMNIFNDNDGILNRYKLFQFEFDKKYDLDLFKRIKDFMLTDKIFQRNEHIKSTYVRKTAIIFDQPYNEYEFKDLVTNCICLTICSSDSLLYLNNLQIIHVMHDDTVYSIFKKIKDGTTDHVSSIRYPAQLFLYVHDNNINYMVNLLKKHFYFYDVQGILDESFLVFRDIKTYVTYNGQFISVIQDNGKEKIFFIQNGVGLGLGDYAIQLPILYYLFLKNKLHGILYCNYKVAELTASLVGKLPLLYQKYNDSLMGEDSLLKDCYLGFLSYFEWLCITAQNVSKLPICVSEVYRIWTQTIKKNCNVHSKIHDLKKQYKYLIGFQRVSKTNNFLKAWSIENTKELIKKCYTENICLINFSADDHEYDIYPYSLHDVDIFQIVDYFYDIDLFVGIDSFFGHLSALLSIHSVSIFEFTSTVFPQYEIFAEKYLPISNNYAIVAKYFLPNRISSKKVFDIIKQVLSGKKIIRNNYTYMVDKKEGIHYEII